MRIKSAQNSLICGMVEFESWDYGQAPRLFQVRFHPDIGHEIDERIGGKWKTIVRRPESLAKWIRNDMTDQQFSLMWTSWAEGHKRGFAEGEAETWERVRNIEKRS